MKMLGLAILGLCFTTACGKAPVTAPVTDATLKATPTAAPPSHKAIYSDPETGVRFQYPDVWKPFAQGLNMAFPAFQDHAPKYRASFAFSPKGNLYERTNLIGLTFSYTVAPVPDAVACKQIAITSAAAATSATSVRYGGVDYNEAKGSDAAMCHSVAETVDTTFRGGRCLIFERDFQTMCPDVRPGERALTGTEEKALQRHLDEAMQSVQITQ